MNQTLPENTYNSGPYVEGVALPGFHGLVLAMQRQAVEDMNNGEERWYIRLEAAHWLLYTMPDLLAEALGKDRRALRQFARRLVPAKLAYLAGQLLPHEVEALARLVRNASDRDVYAYVQKYESIFHSLTEGIR